MIRMCYAAASFVLLASSQATAQRLVPVDPDYSRAKRIVHTAEYNRAYKEAFASGGLEIQIQTFQMEAAKASALLRDATRATLKSWNLNSATIQTAPLIQGADSVPVADSIFQKLAAEVRVEAVQRAGDEAAVLAQLERVENAALNSPAASQAKLEAQAQVRANFDADKAAGGVTSIGSAAWQQQAILGLVSFVATRAEASLLGSLAHQASRQMCGDNGHSPFVPATCLLLSGENAVPAWGTLRLAVRQDLQSLPDSVATFALRDASKTLPGAGQYIGTAVEAVRLLENGSDPLHVLASFKTASGCNKNPACTKLDKALFGIATASDFVFGLKDLENHPEALDQAVRELTVALTPIGAPAATDQYVQRLRSGLVDLNDRIDRLRLIKAELEDSTTARKFSEYTTVLLGIIEQGPRFLPTPLAENEAADFNRITSSARQLNKALAALRAGDIGVAFIETNAALMPWRASVTMPKFFTTYAPVLVQLASDTSASAIKATLESAAAPLGSYTAKRGEESRGSRRPLGLNAYVGGHYGSEEVYGAAGSKSTQFGLFAPVGIEASIGFWQKPASSLSLFVSILDLGGLLSFRTNEETLLATDSSKVINDDAEIGFKQIVSPGIYVVFGLSRSVPVSFGGGLSLHPGLREIRNTETDERSQAATRRWVLFGAVDVPLLRW